MQFDPAEIQFDGRRPWRTLVNLYWPERRWVGLALLSYLFKASPVWILPVVTANIIDVIAHRHAVLRRANRIFKLAHGVLVEADAATGLVGAKN